MALDHNFAKAQFDAGIEDFLLNRKYGTSGGLLHVTAEYRLGWSEGRERRRIALLAEERQRQNDRSQISG